jgi:hypothetical protein
MADKGATDAMNREYFVEQPSKPLYSPRAVFYLTFFGGPVGITLSLLNANRAEDLELRQKSLLAFLIWGVLFVAGIVGLFAFPEYRRVLRIGSAGAMLALSYFLQFANQPVVEAHLRMGGRLAPIWIPLLIVIGLFILTLAIVGLMVVMGGALKL